MNEKDMILYLLDLLSPAEKQIFENTLAQAQQSQEVLQGLQDSLRYLQSNWLKKQARSWAQVDQSLQSRLQRIIDSVIDEVDTDTRSLIQEDLAKTPHLQVFYEDLKTLAKHIEDSDRPAPIEALKKFIKGRQSPPVHQTLQPVWRLRGEANLPLELSVLPEYGFQVKLFIAGLEQSNQTIEGLIIPLQDMPENLFQSIINAQVWLLPSNGYTWFQDEVNTQGKFSFFKVPPGDYTFEMVWPEAFLEVYDVKIPES